MINACDLHKPLCIWNRYRAGLNIPCPGEEHLHWTALHSDEISWFVFLSSFLENLSSDSTLSSPSALNSPGQGIEGLNRRRKKRTSIETNIRVALEKSFLEVSGPGAVLSLWRNEEILLNSYICQSEPISVLFRKGIVLNKGNTKAVPRNMHQRLFHFINKHKPPQKNSLVLTVPLTSWFCTPAYSDTSLNTILPEDG